MISVAEMLLNDKQLLLKASAFLVETLGRPETQEAALELVQRILQHDESLRELMVLAKKLCSVLAVDPVSIRHTNRHYLLQLLSKIYINTYIKHIRKRSSILLICL